MQSPPAMQESNSMPYRNLGRSGLKVSALSLGTWVTVGKANRQVQADLLFDIMREAHAAGINFFDTAEVYASGEAEEVMGVVLKRLGWRRSSYVISTKLFWGGDAVTEIGLSRKHIIEGLRESLRRLQLDCVDVVFCHRPDRSTPIEETCRAMDFVIQQGMAYYWGTSEWNAADIEAALSICRDLHLVAPICEQPQYNMLWRDRFEREYEPLFRRHQLGTTIWSPLASGLLTGKYNSGVLPPDSRFAVAPGDFSWRTKLQGEKGPEMLSKLRALSDLATSIGASMAQLCLAWCLLNPNCTSVLLGATKVSQLKENVGALTILPRITPEVVKQIESILGNKPDPEIAWQ